MKKQCLNGSWSMKRTAEQSWIPAVVPGSMYNDLLTAGLMEDPFYRDNEEKALELSSFDYEYVRQFTPEPALLRCDRILLHCEGLDTLAHITLNGQKLASTDNMHRTYEFNVKGLLKEGENTLHIVFSSPTAYIEKKNREETLWGPDDSIKGFPHIRKAHCMFGWDWGPKLPDMGIWRDIYLLGYESARLEDVYVTQHHTPGSVSLSFRLTHSQTIGDTLTARILVTGPEGEASETSLPLSDTTEVASVVIDNPSLWWPNGFGSQPLYSARIELLNKGEIADYREMKLGLRTITVRREPDAWGESFEFVVNGLSVFAMGADYIPEDNILARCTPLKTERLLKDCVAANFNCVRVWGGGHYPPDYFYDKCDELGLLVWQDHLFACGVYSMTEAFTENITREIEDNVRRIRHHASLALWCGNNEMEEAWVSWGFPKPPKLRSDYIKQFEFIIPRIMKETDPNTFYWPSSPSSGGNFDNPNDENRGDVHYWQVWHGNKPFTDYRNFFFRFVSEFGFQSFPGIETIKSFTLPEDRNIFSHVMENHQKNGSANGKILFYLASTFKYPKDFESLLYASQLLQAEAMKYGVEHWRRNRGRCMGAIYWQLNDCWPVASWASIDSFGRWKALHYFAKRFFAPVLLSACEEGTKVSLHVTNETPSAFCGEVSWKLSKTTGETVAEGSSPVSAEKLSAVKALDLDFADTLTDKASLREHYLSFALKKDGDVISESTVLFVQPKHLTLAKPEIKVSFGETPDKLILRLGTDVLAKYLALETGAWNVVFSDNYFDLLPGDEKVITVSKADAPEGFNLASLQEALQIRSQWDMA